MTSLANTIHKTLEQIIAYEESRSDSSDHVLNQARWTLTAVTEMKRRHERRVTELEQREARDRDTIAHYTRSLDAAEADRDRLQAENERLSRDIDDWVRWMRTDIPLATPAGEQSDG